MTNIREIVTHRGYRRYTFHLSEGVTMVRVLGFGTAPCRSGAAASVEGTFEQGKRRVKRGYSYDELIARNVICRPSALTRRDGEL